MENTELGQAGSGKKGNSGWVWIKDTLGWLFTPLLLGVIFYLIILPLGLVMRLFGRDRMYRKYDRSMQSYRTISKVAEKERLEKPY